MGQAEGIQWVLLDVCILRQVLTNESNDKFLIDIGLKELLNDIIGNVIKTIEIV